MDLQVGYNGFRGVYARCINVVSVEISKRVEVVLEYFPDQR